MEETINESAQGSSPEAPIASSGGELISTVEYKADIVSEPTTKDAAAPTTDDKQIDDSTSEDQKASNQSIERLDQHPRFKEVIKEKNDLKRAVAELNQKLESLSATQKEQPQQKAFDVEGLNDETIFEKLNNNPKEFLGDFAKKIEFDLLAKINETNQRESQQQKIISVYDNYAKENADFDEMWDSGSIQEFIDKNPGHNAISAHMALTSERRIKEATEKAVAEAIAKTQKQLQAKRGAAVIGGGGASPTITGKVSSDLANTKANGGLAATLAARLERMRAGL